MVIKDEAKYIFIKYKAEVEDPLDVKVKRFRYDRSCCEYDPYILKWFLWENGIIHEATFPYTPEQNGEC